MAGKSTYLINKVVDAILRGAYTACTGFVASWGSGNAAAAGGYLYVGLFTVMPPNSQGSPYTGYEVTGNAYARQSIAYNNMAAAGFSNTSGTTGASSGSASPGSSFNLSPIQFPAPTPSSWGVVVGFGIFDAATNGNMWYSGLLGAPINVVVGGPGPFFGAGSLVISEG
jgi:hypothetical protein